MSRIGIIGGSGLTRLARLQILRREVINTPYDEPSGAFTHGELDDVPIVFLARHGNSHHIPPHEVNYRANLWALQQLGVDRIIAFNAVGGITDKMLPASIVIPDQIIDYTSNRKHTFFGESAEDVVHIDFTQPYTDAIRQGLVRAAETNSIEVIDGGCYAATQGPRLESAAEIARLERDGCDIVGMTGMPEAALARELNLAYASCCIVANRAAGKGDGVITMEEINRNLSTGMESALNLLESAVSLV